MVDGLELSEIPDRRQFPSGRERMYLADNDQSLYSLMSDLFFYSSRSVSPEQFGAVGNSTANDTQAFIDAVNYLPPSGGIIRLAPDRCYAINWTVIKNNITVLGQGGAGDGNVLLGLTSFNTASPAVTVGNGATQLRKFAMRGVRIYSQTHQKGLLLNGVAYARFDDCEIGGFTSYALRIASIQAGVGNYYVSFNGTSFFSVSGLLGDLIQMEYGPGFVAAITMNGCNIEGANIAAVGARIMRIGTGVDLRVGGGSWIQCAHGKGIELEGSGRLLGGPAMIDSDDSVVSGVPLLIHWTTNEILPYSNVIGDFRFDGWGKNGLGHLVDMKSIFSSGQGYSYGEVQYRPTVIGPRMHVDTSAAEVVGPFDFVGGGSPHDDDGLPISSLYRSVNNQGSSNQGFIKTEIEYENIVTGGYVDQVGSNVTVISNEATLRFSRGNYVHITGPTNATLQFLGITFGEKRPNRFVEFDADMTIVNAGVYPASGIDLRGVNHNISAKNGDVALFHSYGSINRWRLLFYWPYDGRVL